MKPIKPILNGAPRLLHGGDYNPDQWLHMPGIIDEDFRLMKKAGCNTFSLGIFAWSQYEPREGEFHFEWMDDIMDRMAAAGHNVLLSTPTGAKPFWLSEAYPEVRRVGADRRREPSQTRHNFCWSSPVYREKVKIIVSKLAERYGSHPALKVWHISNELGGECFCDLCMQGFHNWLRERYHNDLDELNRAYWSAFWSHRFSEWAYVDPRDGTLDAAMLDWRRYNAQQIADWVKFETDILRGFTPDIPCTTNLMGAYMTNSYDWVRPHLDFVTEDIYPGYGEDHPDLLGVAAATSWELDYVRCVGGEPARWFTMESCVDSRAGWEGRFRFKSKNMHALEMMQNLAHGSEGVMYFQWRKGRGGSEKEHGAVVGHTGGGDTRVFREVQQWGERLEKLTPLLGSLNRSEVALIYDSETRWATANVEFQRAADHWGITSESIYLQQVRKYYRPFWDRGISVDVLGFQGDWSRYKLIVLPMAYTIDEERAEKIKAFVNGGGTVLATYYCAVANETNLCHLNAWPGLGLHELFGIQTPEFDLLRAGTVLHGSGQGALPESLDIEFINGSVIPSDAEVLATCTDGLFEGQPLLTRRKNAQGGAAWYLGSQLSVRSLDEVVETVCRDTGIGSWLADCKPLPEGCTVQTRHHESETFHFLLNFTPESVTIPLNGRELASLESGESLSGQVELPAWGGMVLAE